ncbi:hypothetical protein IGI04_037016 [Brassica rapa subsp. trilocularis]|uniref:Tetratricopeptide repeat protein 38 n=1 Tax=Brassica rapa subsp. trilocularis TaxID=1813537 RepID=A0ABQ7LG60_BRACM|nr:hypothetical protein IGI04_037016 [Brassica rapa subsp. trilocularis]
MDKTLRCVRWGYEVLSYGRNWKVILEAPLHDKDCVLGNVLAAHYLSSSDHSKANTYVEAARSNLEQSTAYEKAVFEAVSYLISEDGDDDLALEMHTQLLTRFPKDLASLKRAQVLCFYMGQPAPSLSLVQQVLPVNQEESYIHGMLAFPLLELGRMEEAAAASRKGFEINKADAWAHHCVRGSPMSKIEDIYDNHIWKELEKGDAVPPEVYLNAIGLLLRLDVRDALQGSFEDRLKLLAARLTDQENWYMSWHLDILIVWALAKVGETSKARELLEGLKLRLSKMNKKKQEVMKRGIQLGEAVYEYAKGDYKQALERLGSDFNAFDYKIIGASDEQIDVFNEMWCQLLLKTGQSSTVYNYERSDVMQAKGVIKERIKVRDGVPFTWRLLEKSCDMEGNAEAESAGERAKKLGSSYF